MADDIYAVITRVDSPRDGWYEAQPSINEPAVTGVSIKGTPLTVGQKVRIVQSGNWYGTLKGWAFAALGEGIGSVIQSSRSLPGTVDKNRAGASLAYLFHKAGNTREEYHPATITAISGNILTLKDWHTGRAFGDWPLSSDLDVNDFSVDDSVLCRMIPDQLRQVVGWWETYPNQIVPGFLAQVYPGPYNYYIERQPIMYNPKGNQVIYLTEADWTEDYNAYSEQRFWPAKVVLYGGSNSSFFAATPSGGEQILVKSIYKYSSNDMLPAPIVFSYEPLSSTHYTLVGMTSTIDYDTPMPSSFAVYLRRAGAKTMKYWNNPFDGEHPELIGSLHVVQDLKT